MRIVHVSRLCTATMYDRIMKSDNVKVDQSIQKFNRVLTEGFIKNGIETLVYSERPVNRNCCDKKYLPAETEIEDGICYHYARIFNLPVIGIIYAILASFVWMLIHTKRKTDIVVLDTFQLALTIGAMAACWLKRIPCIGVVTDIPTKSQFYSDGQKPSAKSRFNNWMITRSDAMVLLTEQMNYIVNPHHKPYIVIEGFADLNNEEMKNEFENKYSKWTVMYTGGVNKKYGLDILLEGFIQAQIPNSQLIIYGGGPYTNTVKEYSKSNGSIVYGGIMNNRDIVCEQMRATLLVNPRYTHHEFTQYSFPGKNIEYMASGTPTLTTDLPGMPEEYRTHVFILESETTAGMAKMLKDMAEIPRNELHNKGIEARNWMLAEKNNKVQCRKILEFIRKNFNVV